MEQVRVRFAPSPTGYLHLGSVRTALFNYLFAKSSGGKFILRLEDTDKERSLSTYEKDIIDGLKWMGFLWDEGPEVGGHFTPYYQSERLNVYIKYIEKLKEKGLIYYCWCTNDDLEFKKKENLKRGIPPRYDGKCKKLSDKEITKFKDEGRIPTVRFEMPDEILKVEDLIRGGVAFDTTLIGDFIILKQDGLPTFLFANAIDDALMKINYVIRGEDHLSNTPRQIAIYKALNLDIPKFAHITLILAPDKSKLSKRHGAVSLIEYRNLGYLKEALLNYLILLGYSPSKENLTLPEMIDEFSFERFQKSGSIFDIKKLNSLNNYYIKKKDIKEIVDLSLPYFANSALINLPEEKIQKIVEIAREGANTLQDIPVNSKTLIDEELTFDEEKTTKLKSEKVKKILSELYNEFTQLNNFNEENVLLLLKNFSQNKNVPTKEIFSTLRLSLTAQEKGPELHKIIYIFGKEKTLKRIKVWL